MSIFTTSAAFLAGGALTFVGLSLIAKRVNRRRVKAHHGRSPEERLEAATARLEQIAALDPPEPRARKIATKALGEIK